MNAHTRLERIAGPAGALECAVDAPAGQPLGLALICHPHPLHGGTLDNKVVQTLARAFVAQGWCAVRFNFRGVGGSAGAYDEGRGEIDDAAAALAHYLPLLQAQAAAPLPALPFALAGFSFGGHIAASLAQRLAASGQASRHLVLVGPAASRFALPPVPAGTLVIHGEADDVVPLSAVMDWARPQGQPVTVVPGVGHFFHGQLGVLKDLVMRAVAPTAH